MTPFRTLVASLCAAAIATPAMAAGVCIQPAEKTAFEVHSLQSALMVAALNCRQEDAYNSFVTRFRTDLSGAYRSVSGHFRRTGGGNRKLDEYITNLANSHSQDGIRQGTAFCANVAPLWQQVMASRNGGELSRLYQERNIASIHGLETCATRAAPPLQQVRSQKPAKPQQPASQRTQSPQRTQTAQAAGRGTTTR
jgi:hypothetical protein